MRLPKSHVIVSSMDYLSSFDTYVYCTYIVTKYTVKHSLLWVHIHSYIVCMNVCDYALSLHKHAKMDPWDKYKKIRNFLTLSLQPY